MIIVAFDPGETTGICVIEQADGDAKPTKYANVPFLELLDWLTSAPKPDVVVYEDFQILPHKAVKFAGSRMETIQAIGMIKSYVHKHRARQVRQSPTIKTIAERWTQIPPPKNHAHGHWVDAYNHGMYWLIEQKLAKTVLQREAAGNDVP